MSDTRPPTDKEYDRWVRRDEKELVIPTRLRSIEEWVAEIRKHPSDVRNTPDIRPAKGGGTFVRRTTDLGSILESTASIRLKFEAGELLLAQSSLRDLEVGVAAVNARVTEPLIRAGLKKGDALKKARDASAKRKRDDSARSDKELLSMAAPIKTKHPDWSTRRIALLVFKQRKKALKAGEECLQNGDTIAGRLSRLGYK